MGAGDAVRITGVPLAAQRGGQPGGALYTFTAPAEGMAAYELEILLFDGSAVRLALGLGGQIHTIWLPVVARP